VWPPDVERVAALLRATGVEGRLEELALDETGPPGPAVRTEAYECDGRAVVALLPEDRELDAEKLRAATRCVDVRERDVPTFPYASATVIADRLLLGESAVWIEAGSKRHVVALAPVQLMELTKAATVDLVTDA
jgi:prolyl-tRNA editing enzyme YbaK/EbsC (Cys-tRNA(Pro) deacylase)